MKSLQYVLKLSAQAHASLCAKAIASGYIQGENNKGLGKYLDRLTLVNASSFDDNREAQLRALPPGPEPWRWGLEYPRLRFTIALQPTTFETLYETAQKHFIGMRFTSPTSIVGAVLEALGLDLLVPRYPI